MPRISSIDNFVTKAMALIEVRPDTTLITTTYSHHKIDPSPENQNTVGEKARPARAYVKAYDPVSGTCFRVRVSKANELSRIWAALGPIGILLNNKNSKGIACSMANKTLAGISGIAGGLDGTFVSPSPMHSPAPGSESGTPQPMSAQGKNKKKKSKRK